MTFGAQHRFVAKRVTRDGKTFASKGESAWAAMLELRQRAGEIVNLELQPSFRIEIAGQFICNVKADARWREVATGEEIVGDYKGVTGDTPVSRLKRKLVRACHGVEIKIFGPAAKKAMTR
ncbi:MAG: DUF1064 domain-containing protein [Hyphomonadaceae bacterium]